MDHLLILCGYWVLAVYLFLLVNLSESSLVTQGKTHPYITFDFNKVSGKSFDYIVVGGGTAGCPLAATLSEKSSVLLVERGGSPYGNPLVLNREHYGFALYQTDEFSSVAQSFISEDGISNYRGRVLGGTSAINGGFYSRAGDDFVKQVGWDKELVKESHEWVESRIVFKPNLTNWQLDTESGLLEAGFLPYNGFKLEHIEGTKIGGTIFDKFGVRHSPADLLEAGNPENLTILLNATVKNIIFHSNSERNETIARGIQFIQSNADPDQIYKAYINQPTSSGSSGDVILSAGALGSPQILMLSGIGPEKHLQNFSIPLVSEIKGVGREMKDSPAIRLLADKQAEYQLPDPPLVVGVAKEFKFIAQGVISPVSLNATRMEIIIKLAFPESEGNLKLYNTDPRRNPWVKFNYLVKEKDLDDCADMAQSVQRVTRSESLARFFKQTSSPDDLKDFCRRNLQTYNHYHGGCNVGSVVDKDYRVYGVKGLRVIDGSTFLKSPGTNPMGTLLMMGRYQGIKILRERENTSLFNH